MIIALLCIAATTLVLLSESGVLQPSEPQELVKMPHEDLIQLINKVCRVPENIKEASRQSDKCFLELFFLHENVGLKSVKLYEEIHYWDSKMGEIEGEDSLMGNSYFSTEMMNFRMSYSYSNYVEHTLLKANNMAAENATDVAVKTYILAAVFFIGSLFMCWLTKPDSFALPMPNFYETSKTQRRSSLFVKLQNYFHGPDSFELPGAYKKKGKYL